MSTIDDGTTMNVVAASTENVVMRPKAATGLGVAAALSEIPGKHYTFLAGLSGTAAVSGPASASGFELAASIGMMAGQGNALVNAVSAAQPFSISAAVLNGLLPRVAVTVNCIVNSLVTPQSAIISDDTLTLIARMASAPTFVQQVKVALPFAVAARLIEASANSYEIDQALSVLVAQVNSSGRTVNEQVTPGSVVIDLIESLSSQRVASTELAAAAGIAVLKTVSVSLLTALRIRARLDAAVAAEPKIIALLPVQAFSGNNLPWATGLSLQLGVRAGQYQDFDPDVFSEGVELLCQAGLLDTAMLAQALRIIHGTRVQLGVYSDQTRVSLVSLITRVAESVLSGASKAIGLDLMVETVLEDILNNHRPDTVWLGTYDEWSQPTILNETFQFQE